MVIPVLFYTSKHTPYPYSTNWLQEFADPERAKNLYNSDFPLVDITVIPDDEIMEHRSMAERKEFEPLPIRCYSWVWITIW